MCVVYKMFAVLSELKRHGEAEQAAEKAVLKLEQDILELAHTTPEEYSIYLINLFSLAYSYKGVPGKD